MEIERLLLGAKNLVRTGWMQKGVPPAIGETVAEHCFEAAILAYAISLKLKENSINVNPEHAAILALFHDVGETVLGDFPKWATERIDKRDAEKEAFKVLGLGEDLFQEFKSQSSLESKIAKLSDRLSTYLQSLRYIKQGYDVKEIKDSYVPEIKSIVSSYPFSIIKDFIYGLLEDKDF
ncbi:HD domain-containing protein [Acidianus sulfidivorans JP7]|uniref:5'-deoxynucleotidase n=1 Tax=Acidianus sulfidivorans JP7 TaxID=619593 RepID=A0A2U9IKT9_9CREN|nr:HD family hydrolase [Acidianus sulfidivorans]AWR96652.1 HD domain-containing protein [Acidianus sulfidivorans JP7]